ncbi:hypothetical protein [Nonomuraea sp. KM90]|uniref:hypothetical protein n=1 Tax=Nonomuraea sp. KM90 TaxID=3457428 RepID=UPI003FCE77D4
MRNDQPDVEPDTAPDAGPDAGRDAGPDVEPDAVSEEGLLGEAAPDGAHEPL